MTDAVRLRLERLSVEGYGRLRDFVLEPAAEPGTVIVAPNEAGKSTLASAVFRGLFGFEDKSREDARRPWEGGPFAVEQRWVLGDTTSCTIRRDFDTQAVTLEWRVDGAIDHRWEGEPNPRGRSSDLAAYDHELQRLLGFVSPEIFRQTVFVGPGDADARPLATELLRLLSGSERADFRAALREFEDGWYDLTRVDLRHPPRNAKHRPRRIEELAERRDELVRRREAAKAARGARREAEEALERARERAAEIDRELENGVEVREAIRRTSRIREEIEAAKERREEIEAAIGRFADWERRVRERAAALEPVVGYLRFSRDFPERIHRLGSLAREGARIESEEAEVQAALERMPGRVLPLVGLAVGAALAIAGTVLAVGAAAPPAGWIALAAGLLLAAGGARAALARRSRRRDLVRRRHALRVEQARIARERRALGDSLPVDPDRVDLAEELERYDRARRLRSQLDVMQESRRALGDREALERERRRIKEEKLDVLRLEHRQLVERHPYLELGPEYERRFLSDQARLEAERERAQAEELERRRRLADLPAVAEDPHRLTVEIERIDEEIERLQLDRDAYRLAWVTLDACKEEFLQVMTQRLARRIGRVFETMTGGRYHGVRIDPGSLELFVDGMEKRNVPAECLSRGARDQLYFALRVSLLEEMAAERALPIVLDDPFLHFDRQRLARVEETLERLGETHQILLLGHDPRLAGWSFPKQWLPDIAGESVVSPSAG